MIRNIDRIITAIIFVFALCVNEIQAQNSTSSPYSIYGVGVLSQREDAATSGMGHTGVGLAPNNWINISNPAAINNLDSLTFYFNLQLKAFYANEKNESYNQSVYSGNVDGISMGFRATKWWGVALGYTPYSAVGYNMRDSKYIVGSPTKYNIVYKGSGGMSQAYINNAFTFFHLSLGVSVSALWGSITKSETAEFSEAIGGEDIYNTKKYTMNNMFFEYGFQYDFNIKKTNIRFGGVFNERTHLYSSYDHIVSNNISSELFFDDVTPLKDDFYVPRSYAGGISVNRPQLSIAADYRFNEWSDVMNVKFGESVKYKDNWTSGIGLEYRMKGGNDARFYKRLNLRLGYFYGTDYLKIRGVNLINYGVTMGATIPFGRWNNSVVIAYEYQKRGTTFNGLVEELFHNFKISLNIRETWFKKAKFD